MSTRHSFTVPDYIVFSSTIAISLGIGVYSAISGGRQRTTQEFHVGNRELKVIPVALSLIVSYQSSIMMLGFPAEMYTHGIQFWWSSLSLCLAMVIVALYMVPTFYDLKIISAYEYLELRFGSRTVRLIGSSLGVMMNLWYMGVVLFGPATALEAVTGFAMWYSVLVISIVAIFYTTIGGIKAVIWADAFQSFIMIGGMMAVIIKGTLDVGGVKTVFDINKKGGRLECFNMDFDPTIRMTFWGAFLGNGIRSLGLSTNQTSVQRISTMPSKAKAQLITILSGLGFMLFGTLAFAEGLVAYAYFTSVDCDPLGAGLINNSNQIIPYLVMELFANTPGLPGLFLAALFSASLSTLSSGYSSISAIIWSDFIKTHALTISEFKATLIAKMIVVISGVLSIGVAILVMQVEGPMNQISATILSAFSGPLAGTFLLGGLVPRANAKGAIAGVTLSSVFSIWKGLGSSFSPDVVKTPYLPGGSISNCTGSNFTWSALSNNSSLYATSISTTNVTDGSLSAVQTFYSISYMWISTMALAITLIVGTAVSYATGARDKADIDTEYLMPFCERVCCCLPDVVRRVFRFNPYQDKENKHLQVTCTEMHDLMDN